MCIILHNADQKGRLLLMMNDQLNKYINKLVDQGLCETENIEYYLLEDKLHSNRDRITAEIETIFSLLNITTLLFAKPKPHYWMIIQALIQKNHDRLIPEDSESRTFIHDIPIIDCFDAKLIAATLSERKGAIIKDKGIITFGIVGVEQAFVSYSSIVFATFVKYFSDFLYDTFYGSITGDSDEYHQYQTIVQTIPKYPTKGKQNLTRRIDSEDDVYKALEEVGKAVVDYNLVDSFFGNVSYTYDDKIYISQTGSSLDELRGCIDAVPLDGSSTVGLTSSSELSAHLRVVLENQTPAILHGHPKFSVILSLFCPKKRDCTGYECHKTCKEKRAINKTPIVPGEVGTGPYGLVNTIPPALKQASGVIVYGHGVFTTSNKDFNKPFDLLLSIEKECQDRYFKLIQSYINPESKVKVNLPSVFTQVEHEQYVKAKHLSEALLQSGSMVYKDAVKEHQLTQEYIITVNDIQVWDAYYPLCDGDVITLVPMIIGG